MRTKTPRTTNLVVASVVVARIRSPSLVAAARRRLPPRRRVLVAVRRSPKSSVCRHSTRTNSVYSGDERRTPPRCGDDARATKRSAKRKRNARGNDKRGRPEVARAEVAMMRVAKMKRPRRVLPRTEKVDECQRARRYYLCVNFKQQLGLGVILETVSLKRLRNNYCVMWFPVKSFFPSLRSFTAPCRKSCRSIFN